MNDQEFDKALAQMVKDQEKKMYDQLSAQLELERQKYLNALNQISGGSAVGTKSSFPSTTVSTTAPYFDPLQQYPGMRNPLMPGPWPTVAVPSAGRLTPAPAYVFMPAGSLVKCHSGHVCGSLVRQVHMHNLSSDDIDWIADEISPVTRACPVCHSTSFMIDNEHFRRQLLETISEMLDTAGIPEAAQIVKGLK